MGKSFFDSFDKHIPMNRTIPTHIRRDNPATIDLTLSGEMNRRVEDGRCGMSRKGLSISIPALSVCLRRKVIGYNAEGLGSHSQAIRIGNRAGYQALVRACLSIVSIVG